MHAETLSYTNLTDAALKHGWERGGEPRSRTTVDDGVIEAEGQCQGLSLALIAVDLRRTVPDRAHRDHERERRPGNPTRSRAEHPERTHTHRRAQACCHGGATRRGTQPQPPNWARHPLQNGSASPACVSPGRPLPGLPQIRRDLIDAAPSGIVDDVGKGHADGPACAQPSRRCRRHGTGPVSSRPAER